MEFQDNANLNLVVESAPIGICILDATTFVAELLNEKFLEIAGKPKDAIIGKWYWEPFAEARIYYEDALKSVAQTGNAYYADEVELMLIRNGKPENIFVTFVYAPVKNNNGGISKIAVWVLENTKQVIERQKVAEAKSIIEKERDKLNEFFLKAPAGICVWSGPELTYELINPTYQSILPGRNLLGRPILEAVPELKGAPLIKAMQDTYNQGVPWEVHELHVPISEYEGGPTVDRYFTFNFLPRFDINDKVDGVFNFVFEVTEQVIARKKIEESESHFRHLADLVPSKISNALPSGEVTFFNQQWLDFAGMGFEELRDFGYHKMMHPDEIDEFQQKLQEAAKTKKPLVMEMRFKDTNGKYIWHLNIASPILDENEDISMWVGSTTDIQQLKEEEQRKADFISMLSHELKTPVTSIKGYIQLMQREITRDTFKPEKFVQSLDRVDRLVMQLTNLVSDMLDLSRIESARLDLKKKQEDINELVKEVVQDFTLTNPSRKIELYQDGDFFAEIDRDKIAQVVINLISNAIKYSKENSPINIAIFQKEQEKISISVADQGIGIDQKEHDKIFERFYRVEGKAENHFSGFGIGLYLAHSIVARHNGSITLDSKPGLGSTFTISIPIG
ncbi:ATP-binding protein [Pedobacter frigiditerrae]|uniref:ATP-binding protein n=1 Tax=Pedobacter frigiditerrae TaxID=2530452 RepID=UPI00292F9880|nr:ATP-binding protein [Pedobacter frigiditerrae]